MLESVTFYTNATESDAAGTDLGSKVHEAFGGRAPDALVVFASSRYDYREFLSAIHTACTPAVLVGCSSAGEFINEQQGEGAACVVALISDEMEFHASLGRNLHIDAISAAADIVKGFSGVNDDRFLFRSALVLTDALAGYAEDLVGEINSRTGATYQLFGGGAGDDAKFSSTHVFCGTEAVTDAAVALEILSNKPVGIGVSHGWVPASRAFRVTQSEGMKVISLNAMPAVEVFEEHAEETGQKFDQNEPIPFFLHNVIGIDTGTGFKLRVPLAIGEDGSISCAAEIPQGATVHIMSATNESASSAATTAIESALGQLEGNSPKVALFFDCVATRLKMGKEFGLEMNALQTALGPVQYAGCNTYGQIARAEGQFSGFHNCTATVCVFPE